MLGEFIDAYLDSRTDVTLRTRINLLQVHRHCGRAKQLLRAAEADHCREPIRRHAGLSREGEQVAGVLPQPSRCREGLGGMSRQRMTRIFSLARFGGLRTPSEMLLLRWADVDWERGRLLIRSPKTEHHEGKDSRLVPIFPEPVRSLTTISKKRRRIRRSQERKSANRTESRSSARCVKTKKPRSFRGFLPLTAHSISAPVGLEPTT